MQLKVRTRFLVTLAGLIFAPFAQAHTGGVEATGLVAGFMHPLSGVDHLLAAVTMGAWASLSGGIRLRAMAAAFPGMMAIGVLAGLNGIALSFADPAIALSVISLGFLVALAVRLPQLVALAVVGGIALLHGYVHGTEMPVTASVTGYAGGLLLATALLFASGVVSACLLMNGKSRSTARVAGGFIALTGSLLLLSG